MQKLAQEREQRSLFPPCFFSVILLLPKLSKPMIYLSYFQLAPQPHRCFYGKSPCFLFFLSIINRFPPPRKTRVGKSERADGSQIPDAEYRVASCYLEG